MFILLSILYPLQIQWVNWHKVYSTKQAQNGCSNSLRPLIQDYQVRIESDPMAVQYLPLRSSLVYLWVQILQVENLQNLHQPLLKYADMSFVSESSYKIVIYDADVACCIGLVEYHVVVLWPSALPYCMAHFLLGV
jgi:hypothetical protein